MPDTSDLSTTLVHDLLKEKRADRRWKNIRFVFWFTLFAYLIISAFHHINHLSSPSSSTNGRYVALIRLAGMIAPGKDFSAETIIPLLQSAFADKNACGVILDIDSPGGTPVQASIIHDAILTLKKRYHKPIIVVGEDMLTSGAYYVAVAGDKIYVNPNTLTGSIGVIMKGFGFVELMKKIGVERRVYTIGDDKDRLDPFLPQSPNDVKKISQVMNEVHDHFAQAVLAGRKGKLHADPSLLFSGDFWSGQSAWRLGLVDGLGNLMDVMDKEFHTTRFKEYDHSGSFFRKLSGQLSSAMDTWFLM
jgi:protease IV